MITEKDTGNALPSAMELAFTVVMERIQSLPEADRNDLFELTKIFFKAQSEGDQEGRDSAYVAMQEILDQEASSVKAIALDQKPGNDLERWVNSVASKIREHRKAAGLNQEELAQRTGLTQPHISRLENGEHSPSFVTLEKIAEALNVPVSVFDPSAP